VNHWQLDDLQDELDDGLRGRTPEIGQRIFVEASCAQCHRANGEGGDVGPALNGVFERWEGDRVAVLREILEPSHRIDPKYAVQLITTIDGKTISGIVKSEDQSSLAVLVDPEAKEPTIVQRADVDEVIQTSFSTMPKALLDRFTKDEIFELLAFLQVLEPTNP
jgi:putative heme-binding domain-containing protein